MAGDPPVPQPFRFRELVPDQREKQQDGQRPNRVAGHLPIIESLDSQQIGRRAKSFGRDNDLIEPFGQLGFPPHHSIQVDPGLGVGWNILGVVQRAQGLDADAEASFRKALAVDPKDGAPCGNLENLLRAQGRVEEAQAYRERGLEIRKRDPFFNAFLAEEALGDQQWDEAARRVKQAIKLLPMEPEFYWIQARVALAQGRTKDAIKALEKARKWAQPEAQARWDSKLSLLRNIKPE